MQALPAAAATSDLSNKKRSGNSAKAGIGRQRASVRAMSHYSIATLERSSLIDVPNS
jgi:hypothetical protein